jgi:YYY domain-containing protein
MNREKYPWLYDLIFLLVFMLAGYLRLTGVDWGQGGGQHPDENHFAGVLEVLRAQKCADPELILEACPPEQVRWLSLADYFNSDTSSLSPYNRGFAFYVYGNLPMTIVRVVADATDQTNLRVLGRQFSALADLSAIFFLYMLVSRMYGRGVALLAALFSALTVLQIQQSHFLTVDLFANAFAFLVLWFAVGILEDREQGGEDRGKWKESGEQAAEIEEATDALDGSEASKEQLAALKWLFTNRLFLLSIGFGFALGMAMASKINIAPLAVVLPGAFLLRFLIQRKESGQPLTQNLSLNTDYWTLTLVCLVAGGLATIISFRIFQPYAFDGIALNPQWVANIREQRVQARGDADLPWNLQWARRTHLYSFTNLTVWGLGLPLGILAWAGFLYMGWRILKGEWRHALLWGWTAAYFAWQSLQFNPTMRYQLPIYPLLAMMAAWFVFELAGVKVERWKGVNVRRTLAGLVGVSVVTLTAIWAFAFHSIYLRDEPRIAASRWIFQNVPGPINVEIQADDSIYNQPLPFPIGGYIQSSLPYTMSFIAQNDGVLESITLGHAVNRMAPSSTLSLTLSDTPVPMAARALATASLTSDFPPAGDPRGDSYTITFDKPVRLKKGSQYFLQLKIDAGALEISGATVANETDYDYPLPLRVDNYDAFGGIYRGDLNLQVYWDDNVEKLNRFVEILNDTDFILIPTNHQYGQITRLPERYPLTTHYYRELIGCPEEQEIAWCYRVAQPGTFEGRLGYELVAVFESYPTLGPIVINDQAAEEAFTFYDHPKVMIFQKTQDFNISEVQSSLSRVDLTGVIHLTPRQFDEYADLLLPGDKLRQQRAGGTWSQLFDYDWVQNRYPVLGLVIWYFFILLLGLAIYPLTRLAMPGLADKGYPLSRILGLVLFGYLAWLAGSVGIPYTRLTIAMIFGLLLLMGAALAYYQRAELRQEWRTRRGYFLMIECLFLGFFLLDLLIRLGNPDLWHPARGGERPMDFSYFNAVLKSSVFPPYDPWFGGGYINYYYYGFVLVGTPVKLLGIVPSIAYNFILPTLFAMVGVAAFSLGWNLFASALPRAAILSQDGQRDSNEGQSMLFDLRVVAGLAASTLTLLLGNLGTIQLVYQKLQELGARGEFSWEPSVSIFQRWGWAIQGFLLTLQGGVLPMGPGEWYWNPSRVVPPRGGNEITEFPLFTFLYSDLHAHMIAIPLALLAISWALAMVVGRARWRNRFAAVAGLALGGLLLGVFYPTNLSDAYTYLLIGILAAGYAVFRYTETFSLARRIALTLGAIVLLYLLSRVLYEPYRLWYSQAYSALDPWNGPFTPLGSYLTHWLVFLFIIASWMAWETREWMAATPVSALNRLKPFALLIEGALVFFALALLVLAYRKISIGWIALPIAAWAGILLLRPALPDAKRFVLFLIGTALLITIVVEVVVVSGDIGRQNTIFKFYMQAWLLLAVSAGAAFTWTLPAFLQWLPGWRLFWQTAMILLVGSATLFTITGTAGKLRDRWIVEAPRTLDSMTFMKYAHYDDFARRLDLSEDYAAIRWMQDHVEGSPVIVEANCPEYRWCTRFTIYTGLPGVVGWNWHQRQQRVFSAAWVEERVMAVGDFYNSIDAFSARGFLERYNVRYIVVGQLERAAYTADGIAKFERFDGKLWEEVYRDGRTAIYEVLQ